MKKIRDKGFILWKKKEFDKYLAGHVKRIAREEKELRRLTRQAEKKARLITEILIKKYRISEVYLFGSLARGDFDHDSDIDLAVAGLPEKLYLEAYGLAGELSAPLKVDLVLLETAEPSLKKYVLIRFVLQHRHLLRFQLKRRAVFDFNTSIPSKC